MLQKPVHGGGGGVTTYSGLDREAPPKRGAVIKLAVGYKALKASTVVRKYCAKCQEGF